jgi:hypothetical protein
MECLPEEYIKYVLSTEESARFRTRRISNCVWLDLGVSDNGTFDFERRLRGAAFPGIEGARFGSLLRRTLPTLQFQYDYSWRMLPASESSRCGIRVIYETLP